MDIHLSLCLIVTPKDSRYRRFKVETIAKSHSAMVLEYLPDHSWAVEKATMKFFTKEYIRQLGKLIEIKRPEWF